MLEFIQDEAQAYICTVANGAGCSAAEVEYADLMKAKSGMERKKTLLQLKNQLKSDDAEDDADLKSSLWQRVSILKQFVDTKPEKALPNKLYKEVYNPDDWKYPPMPDYVEKAYMKMDLENYVQMLVEPYLPKNVTENRPKKPLWDYVWENAVAESNKGLPIMQQMYDKWYPEIAEARKAMEEARKKDKRHLMRGEEVDSMADAVKAPAVPKPDAPGGQPGVPDAASVAGAFDEL